MTKRLGHTTGPDGFGREIAGWQLRMSILQDERLRRELTKAEEIQRTEPARWRSLEAARRARNRETAATSRRLVSLGLAPIRPELSLAQRRQELQRLQRRTVAEIAAFRAASVETRTEIAGKPLASRPSRRRHG
jgi:hypothetical protein